MQEHFRIRELGRQLMGTLHYGFHQCRVVVQGMDLEQAVTRLMTAGIEMMNLQVEDDISVSFSCSWAEYKRIGEILGKKYDAEIEEERGLLVILRSMAARAGLTAGVACTVIMLLLQQNLITRISIQGNVKTDEAQLRASLAEVGLAEGKLFSFDADLENIKAEILSRYPEIRWIGIRRQGSCMNIEIKEGDPAAAAETQGMFDLVAAKSGYVDTISGEEGYALVKPGDYVEKGQVLISAAFPLKNTTYDTGRDQGVRMASARGTVTGKVIYRLELEFPAEKYSTQEMTQIAEEKIRMYVMENIPKYIKMDNKDLKFGREENIIVCSITLQTTENIAEKKENELVQNNRGEDGNEGNEGDSTDH